MEVYVEEALTEEECLKKIHKKYGKDVTIIRKHVKIVPIFFGLWEKELCEVSFSLDIPKTMRNYEEANQNYEKNMAFIDAHAKRIKIEEHRGLENTSSKVKEDAIKGEESDASINSYEALKDVVEVLTAKIESASKVMKEHKNIEKIKSILKDNDFAEEYIASLIESIKENITLKDLEDYSFLSRKVLDYIAKSIRVKEFEPIGEKKVIAFVGPTGVGKTTSLVKLAALHFVHIQNKKKAKPLIHVITTDGYKIGAVNHIEKYCNCMDLSLSVADTVSALRAIIDINKEKMDMIFIDSSGRNPNDKAQVQEVEKFINGIEKTITDVHLVINAGTKMKDIELIMDKYCGCKYDYVIISKLDETADVGNVISVLSKKQVPVSYVTTGQVVPTDITFAGMEVLLKKLRGFEEEREYIEEHYKCEDLGFGENIWLTKQKI